MHDTTAIDNNNHNEPKATVGILQKARLVEEERHDAEKSEQPSPTSQTSNSGNNNNSNRRDGSIFAGSNGSIMDADDQDSNEASKVSGDGDVEMEDNTQQNDVRNYAETTREKNNNSAIGKLNGESTNNGEISQSANSGGGGSSDKKSNSQKREGKTNGSTATSGADDSSSANPAPVMRGTFFYEDKEKGRRHIIRGNWNYENSSLFPPQRFELQRTLAPEEELEKLPLNGEFSGSFSLAYLHMTSKGKQKERSRVVSENGVKITFTQMDGTNKYKVNGQGNNQFGVFYISGSAKPSDHDGDKVMDIEFRKTYEPTPPAPVESNPQASAGTNAKPASKTTAAASKAVDNRGPLPDPSPSFSSGVYCLRGQLYKEQSQDLGMTEVVHRINGMWAAGLDLILADPQNTAGRLSRFEYEHKAMVPSGEFPVSGRYSGWFEWKTDDGSATRINERDVTLKFRKNNAGYHNIEGKGSNVFGKYTISGTLTLDNVVTIFRHFAPRKLKAPKAVTSAPPPLNAPQAKRNSLAAPTTLEEPKLKLEDVKVPDESGKNLEPISKPLTTTYSAVSQGVFRLNKDGSHSCSGKWAVARDHLAQDGQTSTFIVRLEAHDAQATAESAGLDPSNPPFPLDSAMYKGSFQLKKQGGSRVKSDTIVDQQVVMKFRQNSQGSYNVYGKGINAIGTFELFGTLVVVGKNSGQIELYRTYPTDLLNKAPEEKPPAPLSNAAAAAAVPASLATGTDLTNGTSESTPKANNAGLSTAPPTTAAQRRESTRMVKLPPKLEENDPQAQLTRAMSKCAQLLQIMKEKDVQMGAFFGEPVDPVALGIPTYYQIIKEPMDLKTVSRKMEANEIDSPEEFARLMRLIFENAINFNVDPAHSVHRAARSMLTVFNQKFRDIDRHVQKIRKDQGIEVEDKTKKGPDGKKKKKPPEKPKSLREQRHAEAKAMATENAKSVAAIVAAAPPSSANVSRTEFNLLLRMIEQMQHQLVQTHTLLASLFPGDEEGGTPATQPPPVFIAPTLSVQAPVIEPAPAPAPPQEKKKPPKRKSEVLKEQPVVVSDATPLTIEEQTLLTETINELDPEHLGGVIQIIREAAPVGADEDEIDLEIDLLDHKTQRKLLRHVSKFVKKSIPKAKKPKTSAAQAKKSKAAPAPKQKPQQATPPPAPAPAPAPKPKPPSTDSFFLFGNKDDSDSDSDEEPGEVTTQPQNQVAGKTSSQGGKEFKLASELDDLDDDKDDDDDNDFDFGSKATSWNISKPSTENSEKDGDDDDAWGAAREAAAARKVREAERKLREKKIEIEAEKAKDQRLADAAARGEEIRAQRAEEEAKEAELREQQEREAEEARKAAREAARAQVQSVEQTVDLDAQRDIMKQYEQSYAGGDYGSASPSSDFGF
ncbi:hypothetical protein ACA910_017261 [Epithemia clementina (nom. ined.)]